MLTIPDELVQAAAEALDADDAPAWWWGEGPLQDAGVDSTLAARIALQAAFAKLGECEAARESCGRCSGKGTERWQKSSNPADGKEEWPCVRCQGRGWNVPPIIAALAREFGGQE